MQFLNRLALLLLVSAFFVETGGHAAVAAESKLAVPQTDDGLPGVGPIRRYQWFTRLWERRRSEWAKRVEADRGSVVFLGDSITQGWGDDFGGAFPGMKVANRGISGDTTRGVLIRLKEDVLSLKPTAIVLLIGTNDLEEGADPEMIVSNLKLILAELKAHDAKMPVILCQVFPSSTSKKRPAAKIKQVNELYAAAVKGDAQVTVMETWRLFADADGNARKAEFPDLLHPNKTGYGMWASAIRPILATAGLLETEADEFKIEAGYVSLFNGHDLSGWGFRAKKTLQQNEVFDGKQRSHDGRFLAMHGRLVVTTPAEGRRIQQLWTTREFHNDFVLKLEFRATPYADSGVFIRGPQLQCRDYPLAGPYFKLEKYRPQDWNELIISVKGGIAHCVCNGEVLNAEMKVPTTGPIGLEGDRGQMEYRRIRIKESK
jgi:lysophospholipase L1-like esterase